MNPENRKQAIMIGVVVVGLIGAAIYVYMQLPRATGNKGAMPKPAGAAAVSGTPGAAPGAPGQPGNLDLISQNIDKLLEGIQEVNFNYEAERIERDPMTPLVGAPVFIATEGEGQPVAVGVPSQVRRKSVTGIVWDPVNPLAVVDDEVVTVGHTYPTGVRVRTIEQDRVIFEVQDTLIPVEMKEQ